MKDRGTYLLLALFFAGLVGLWAADFARVPTRSQVERMSTRVLGSLIDVKPDDLRKVEILGGEGGPLVFERREGNRWQMTTPMVVAADPSKVETLAYNLKELSRRPDSATLDADPTRYGLAPPERTVKLWGSANDAPLATLDVGRLSLDRRYVRAGGSEGVEVVDARGLDLLRLPAVRWRDHELFRVPSFEVDAVKVSDGDRQIKLRRTRGAWHVVEPFRVLASDARVDGLIADLGSLRVLDDARFVANDVSPAGLDRYGLKTPALSIEVESTRADRRGGPQVLHVGKPVEGQDGQVYARRGDQDDVVIVERRVLRDLVPEPNAFRSPKVADIDTARVVRIGVADAEGRGIEAVRSGNDWGVVASSVAKGDRQAIQDFLKALDQLQTSIYLGPAILPEAGLDKPSLTLKIWQFRDPRAPAGSAPVDPKGDLAMTLKIGRRDVARKSIYAQLEGDPTILALPDAANAFLPRNPLAFRDRQVLAVDVDRIEQFRFVGPTRKITLTAPIFKAGRQVHGLAPTGWWMAQPVQAPADAASVGHLLRLLANLRAESLVSESAEGLDQCGLKTPALAFTWSSPADFSMLAKPSASVPDPGAIRMEDHTLMVGSAVPGKLNVRYARLADSPLIFTVGPDVLTTLDAEWHDHRVLAFEADRLREVRLDWPDRGLALNPIVEAGARKWGPGADQDAPDFDPGPIAPLVQAASRLSTGRFIQYAGEIAPGFGLAPARLAVRFGLDDGSPPRTIRVGAPVGNGQAWATTAAGNEGPIFLVPEAPFSPLFKAPRRKSDLPEDVFAH